MKYYCSKKLVCCAWIGLDGQLQVSVSWSQYEWCARGLLLCYAWLISAGIVSLVTDKKAFAMQRLEVLLVCILYLVHCVTCDIDTKDRLEPPPGQRCSGRNYQGRRCCTPENPCDEGEGDCDGPGDGGQHDGHAGCKGDLVCGSNNCKQFGAYFHEKDDCCEKPKSKPIKTTTTNPFRNSIYPTYFRPIGKDLTIIKKTAIL